jgi:hypothetical protein
MKTFIMLALLATAAIEPVTIATARSPAESGPQADLVYNPECGFPQSGFLLLCDSLEGF